MKIVAMETSNCKKRLLLKLFHDKFRERAQIKRVFLGCKRKAFAPLPPRPYNPEAGLIIATQTIDNLIVVISLPEQKSALNASRILLILR